MGRGSLGGGGGAAVPGAPTHVPQNDPLVALIIVILTTDMCFWKKKIFTPWGVRSQQPRLGGWMGEVRGQGNSSCLHTCLDSP